MAKELKNISRYRYRWWVLLTGLFAILMVNTQITSINLIISPISQSLHISLTYSQWIITTYLLFYSALVIACGKLGDIIGNNKTLLIGAIVFVIASLIGGFAQNFLEIIICRISQGVGAALMWPNAIATVFKSFPEHHKGFAVGMIAGVTGLALAIGPPLGAYLASALNWRWVFFFNAPFGLFVIMFCFFIKDIQEKTDQKLDMLGVLVMGTLLSSLVYCINLCNHFQKYYYWVILLIIFSIILLWLFVKIEKKASFPLVDITILKIKNFTFGCIARALVTFAFLAFLFITSLFLKDVYGFSTLKIGAVFLPITFSIGFLSPISGHIVDRSGPILPIIIGLVSLVFGYFFLSIIGLKVNFIVMLLIFSLLGLGYCLVTPAFLNLSLKAVVENKTGFASAMFYMTSSLGGLIGVACVGAVLAHFHNSNNNETLIRAMPIIARLCAGVCLIPLFIILLSKDKDSLN